MRRSRAWVSKNDKRRWVQVLPRDAAPEEQRFKQANHAGEERHAQQKRIAVRIAPVKVLRVACSKAQQSGSADP